MADLTDKQIKFLSKYMKVVSKKGVFKSKKKREKAISFNDLIQENYAEYIAQKKIVDRLLADVKKLLDERKAMLGAISSHQGGEPLQKFRTDLGTRNSQYDEKFKEVAAENTRVMNAPEKKPLFAEGVVKMGSIAVSLYWLKDHMPSPPPLINDGVLGALYLQRSKIAPLEIFADSKFLNERIVHVELVDPEADRIRTDALDTHDGLCVTAYNAICDLIDPVLQGTSTLTAEQGEDATNRILSDLMDARKDPIRNLIDVIKAAAESQLDDLVDGGNDIAVREKKRADEIKAKVEKTLSQLEQLKETLKNLKKEQDKAKGFKEKQAVIKKYQDTLARMDSMEAYIAQLGAYDDNMALRVERITRADDADAKGQLMVSDVDSYIDSENAQIAPMDSENAMTLMTGSTDKKGNHSNGMYDNLLDKFTRASKRVSVDVKLFPGETDLTDISADQFATLKAMLDAAKAVATDGDKLVADAKKLKKTKEIKAKVDQAEALFGKAKFMFDEANKLYFIFDSSNKFPLPDVPVIPDTDKVRIEKLLKKGGIDLDRFWGIGGDNSGDIRSKLTAAKDAFEQVIAGPIPHDFSGTDTLLTEFRQMLEAAQKSFRPSPQDEEAKKKAGEARDAVVDALLGLYKTKERSLGEIADIPEDHLLIIERNGKKEYHEILTKGNGDEINRRDDKDIPRESINLLLEQATMLELLAQSGAPDSADEINKVVEESNKKLDNISNGSENFKYIKGKIKDCEKLLGKSTLEKWIPANLQATKVNFATFKEEYPTKYIVFDGGKLDGKVKIDAFHTAITKLIEESDAVRVAYTEADKIMVQVEKDFENKSGATKPNLETKLAEIIKGGPKALMKGYTSAPDETREINALLDQMKNSLKELTSKSNMDGDFKPRIKSARTTLDTKTENGIAKGKAEAEALRDEMKAQLDKLTAPVGLQYLKDLASFLKGQGDAAVATKEAIEKMNTKKAAVKEKLGEADDILKTKNKANFKSYKEYKTIYDSLKTQYDTAKKGYEKDSDVENAASEFDNILPNATQLAKDLTRLNGVWEPGQQAVNFAKFQGALNDKILSVREAAKKASEKTIEEAADDPQEVIDIAAKAAETLAIVGKEAITDIVKIRGNLQDEADAAIKNPDEKARYKALANVREKALAETRRIRAETEKHPAIKIYRDNPFVKDISWPGFAAALHELEVQILTTLQPR